MAQAASAAPQPQTSIYETTIENPELEELLDKRQKLKEKASAASKDVRRVTDDVKEKIAALDLADAPVRIGRFVVALRPVEGRSVAFETGPTTRLVIKPIPEA